jgi:hypothetical protein
VCVGKTELSFLMLEKFGGIKKEKHQVCFLYLPKQILLTNPMLPGLVSKFSCDPSNTAAFLRLLHFTIDIKDGI